MRRAAAYLSQANPVPPAELADPYRANALFDGHRDTRSSATGSWLTKPATPVRDGLAQRDFTAQKPNLLWLTDIERPIGNGKLYSCGLKDVCGNRIVGYSIDSRMKSRIAVPAINKPSQCARQPTGKLPAAWSTLIEDRKADSIGRRNTS